MMARSCHGGQEENAVWACRMVTRQAPQARMAWCEPNQCNECIYRFGATSSSHTRPMTCASTSGRGATARTATAAASQSTSGGGAAARTTAAAASASTSGSGAAARTAMAAASASTSGSGAAAVLRVLSRARFSYVYACIPLFLTHGTCMRNQSISLTRAQKHTNSWQQSLKRVYMHTQTQKHTCLC